MSLVVLMTTYHRPRDFQSSVESLLRHTPELGRLHILDNSGGAIDNELSSVLDPRVTVHRSAVNLGKGRIVREHYAAAMEGCPLNHFVGVDGDVVVPAGWYKTMLRAAREVAPWAAIAPAIRNPLDPDQHMHVTGPATAEVRPGVFYNRATAGCLLLIRRPFWENWGGYPGDRLYGNDDGALCREAIRRNQFIGYTNRVVVDHHHGDDAGYRDWKKRNVSGEANEPGYWG